MLRLETGSAPGFYSNSGDDCLVPVGWSLTLGLLDWQVLVFKEPQEVKQRERVFAPDLEYHSEDLCKQGFFCKHLHKSLSRWGDKKI